MSGPRVRPSLAECARDRSRTYTPFRDRNSKSCASASFATRALNALSEGRAGESTQQRLQAAQGDFLDQLIVGLGKAVIVDWRRHVDPFCLGDGPQFQGAAGSFAEERMESNVGVRVLMFDQRQAAEHAHPQAGLLLNFTQVHRLRAPSAGWPCCRRGIPNSRQARHPLFVCRPGVFPCPGQTRSQWRRTRFSAAR